MCGCAKGKNQTPEAVFQSLIAAKVDFRDDSVLGIGIFVVPAPERGILEYRTVTADRISYEECLKRGANCDGFQWLPLNVTIKHKNKSFSVRSLAHYEKIKPLYCNDSCRGGCPMGCTCFGNDIYCRPNR